MRHLKHFVFVSSASLFERLWNIQLPFYFVGGVIYDAARIPSMFQNAAEETLLADPEGSKPHASKKRHETIRRQCYKSLRVRDSRVSDVFFALCIMDVFYER